MTPPTTGATRTSPGDGTTTPATWSDLPRTRSGAGLAFHRIGEGPAVVLIHGVGLRAEAWGAQIPHLCAGHTVFAVDLPGHGESARLPMQSPGLQDFTDAIAAWIKDTPHDPVLLAGHSMGAMIALDLATRWPRLCLGVAACNAVYRRAPDALAAIQSRAAALAAGGSVHAADPLGRWFGQHPEGAARDSAAACRRWLEGNQRQAYAAAYTAFAHHDAPADGALADLQCPALFLTGALDPNSTAAMSLAMAEQVPAAQAVILEDAAHMAPMTHPGAVTSALSAFFRRCLERGNAPHVTGS